MMIQLRRGMMDLLQREAGAPAPVEEPQNVPAEPQDRAGDPAEPQDRAGDPAEPQDRAGGPAEPQDRAGDPAEPQDRAGDEAQGDLTPPSGSRDAPTSAGALVSRVLGFWPRELLTLADLTRLLHRPADPAALAATRIMFGVLMVLDVPQERGMGVADVKWGDPNTCRFPLLTGLTPLPLPYMVLIYGLMIICTVLMVAGYRWRLSCGTFVLAYWYLFLLDKSTWNNHSYLYGLLASILLVSDPHRCWSVDGRRERGLANSHVPLWNYTLLRSQVFLLYFLAGIKKVDRDWLSGYSMQHLAHHWVFSPFRLLLSNDNIDYFLIHLGGFMLDLTLGFFLYFDATRRPALLLGAAFHIMNSMIFSIGMFPWVCLATLPVFCSKSWPRRLLAHLGSLLHRPTPAGSRLPGKDGEEAGDESKEGKRRAGRSLNTVDRKYQNVAETTKDEEDEEILRKLKRNPDCYYGGESGCLTSGQKARSLFVVTYVLLQLFLPFSHFITQGYNTWTEGPYGYSWDMMVHSWDTLHVKITAITNDTGEKLYLDPNAWLNSNRWTSHADMAVQYGRCLQERLEDRGLHIRSLHFDVWKSLNQRFQQRVFDPTVNILEAPWSPWEKSPWVLPLATSLSPWRQHLPRLLKQFQLTSPAADAIFVADFPGLTLENFLSEDLSNITLEVLQGEVRVLLPTEDQLFPIGHVDAACCDLDNTKAGLCVADSLNDLIDSYQHICCYKERGNNANEQLAKNYNEEQNKRSSKEDFRRKFGRQHIQNSKRASMTQPSCLTPRKTVLSVILGTGDKLALQRKSFHSVITTSKEPSSYMYTFINTTLQKMYQTVHENSNVKSTSKMLLTQRRKLTENIDTMMKHDKTSSLPTQEAYVKIAQQFEDYNSNKDKNLLAGKTEFITKETKSKDSKNTNSHLEITTHGLVSDHQAWKGFIKFLLWKWTTFKRSGRLLVEACHSILSETPMKLD